MKFYVDPNTCIGCTQCAGICPEVYTMEGRLAHAMEGDVPGEYVPGALEGEEACPVDAISHAE